MADDPSVVAATAAVKAVTENADRLGLLWQLRPATVEQIDPINGITVTIDGDKTPVTATSMIGNVYFGQRVYVLLVPPCGIFIAGFIGKPQYPLLVVDACSSNVSANIGAEAVVLTSAAARFDTGRCFEIRVKSAYTVTVGGFALHLLRRGTSTAGVAVAEWEMPSVGGGTANCFNVTQQVTNTSGAPIVQQMSLTFIQTAGTGSLIDASPFGPYYFQIWDIGPATSYPNRDPI